MIPHACTPNIMSNKQHQIQSNPCPVPLPCVHQGLCILHLFKTDFTSLFTCHFFLSFFFRARLLGDEVRAATVNYLSVIKGAEGGITKLSIPKLHLHPALQRAHRELETAWRQVRDRGGGRAGTAGVWWCWGGAWQVGDYSCRRAGNGRYGVPCCMTPCIEVLFLSQHQLRQQQ